MAQVEPSLRVAYSRDLGLGTAAPQVTRCTDAAAALFAATLGAQVEEAAPDLSDAEQIGMTIWAVQMGYAAKTQILSRIDRSQVDPALLRLLDQAERVGPYDYYEALVIRRGALYQRVRRFFATYDLLLTPTLLVPPFPHPGWEAGPTAIAGRPINPMLGWLLTYPFNLTGQPAISVPCGFSDEGLPIGLQIVGRRHADAAVLRAAAAYEHAASWAEQRPPLN